MASEGAPARKAASGTLLLAAASAAAGIGWHAGEAPLLAGGALGAVLGAALLRGAIRRLQVNAETLPLEVPVGLPRELGELSSRALHFETQLEHAPVAIFSANARGEVTTLNTRARRLLAPGRIIETKTFHSVLASLPVGQRKIVEYETEAGPERALATSNAVTLDGEPQRLIALIPVEDELEAEAMRAWQKLVHVLTHEMMNSLTPVASLSQTAREMLRDAELPADLRGDLGTAMDAIGRRAESLTHFVSGYRTLASVPEARPQRIVLSEMFARLRALFANASFSVEPDSLELMADSGQLEQALVNLLHNAEEATANVSQPMISVTARLTRGARLRIEVCDNGPGVPDHLLANIFTPFFSTKARGSGIGLAMVRQLVHRNGGAVRYAKFVGPGACFAITL
ncbi:sensor histidine kinase [Massilia endophytica]|uniref:sensor histidine kinase n=1 Tax=Massilia endophytica TaxID=2899220 RepID=UPI001E463947|nr:ATP-binding protein [Massilia endophytica]UGQ45437.1 ATP-binding protein [Massilia endophytica]